jgi:hypothetical protein
MMSATQNRSMTRLAQANPIPAPHSGVGTDVPADEVTATTAGHDDAVLVDDKIDTRCLSIRF